MAAPSTWLNDQVINRYLELLVNRSQGKVAYLNTFFYSSYIQHGYQRVARWTNKIDVFSKNKILVPLHENENHWTLIGVNLRKKKIYYFDSFHHPKELTWFLNYLEEEYMTKTNKKLNLDKWVVINKSGPLQSNQHDCGVFVCINAEMFSRSKLPHFTQSDTLLLRQRILYEILSEKLCL